MSWAQVGAAVVVAAQQFNPSVFSQTWLLRNHLLEEADFMPGTMFTDMLVQVRSRRFQLMVIEEQLQFFPNVPLAEEQQLIVDKVGTIFRTLPHTPFRALGLNFCWHLQPREEDVPAVSRELFYRPDNRLYQHFASDDAHFGGYLSKNVIGFRMKLDVKPLVVTLTSGQVENRLQFAFNFHADLGADAAQQIEGKLLRWNDLRQEAERIIYSVEPRRQT